MGGMSVKLAEDQWCNLVLDVSSLGAGDVPVLVMISFQR